MTPILTPLTIGPESDPADGHGADKSGRLAGERVEAEHLAAIGSRESKPRHQRAATRLNGPMKIPTARAAIQNQVTLLTERTAAPQTIRPVREI